MPSAIDPYAMGGQWEKGHTFRYYLAAGFIGPEYSVIDFGCGIGYGSEIIANPIDEVQYWGVDIDEECIERAKKDYEIEGRIDFSVEDLNKFVLNDLSFNVAVCFENIEHVENTDNLIKQLKKANKWIICSVPIIPTVGINPYHVHDFTYDDLPKLIEDDQWELFQRVKQQGSDGNDVYGIYVFRRKK